ncbi:MAG: L-histidine N(alpha)-methyltransferase [Candidatus Micrarchaeota archaeon]
MKDNFFSSQDQISEFLTAIQGRSEIPLKFEYLNKGAMLWKKAANDRAYGLSRTEKALLTDNAASISRTTGPCNVFDLGCGDGTKASILLKEMAKDRAVKYVPIDISADMLDIACSEIKKIKNIQIHPAVQDFEEGNLSNISHKHRDRPNLFLFLGNTLGNCWNKSRVLTNIRESMTRNDYALIGIENVSTNTENLLEKYRNPALFAIQSNVLRSIGIQLADGAFEVKFNKEKSQVETRFVIKKNLRFEHPPLDLKKGQKILLMLSYKATPQALSKLFSSTGLKIVKLFSDSKKTYTLALVMTTKL